ncbi:DUF6402 family protein [Burkholderia sp. LMG 21824]|uniref:DUF6402 family protein n=1 Tax=Burkholderia sp. LMG 21824 TaxID=3158172 RepID=UPI003C2DA209
MPTVAGAADIPRVEYPVAVVDVRVVGNVYYPVRNNSFREWQQRHRRGGDFIIFFRSPLYNVARTH